MSSSFDDRAATWDDDPRKVERARDAAASIRSAVPLSSDTRLLEYGAGTGLLAEELVADVGPITLAEPSAGMRDVLTAKVEDDRLPGATIWDLDLARDPVPDARFDLIASLMTLHHIPDLAAALGGLHRLLADDGVLCIIDLEEDVDRSFHSEDFDGHHGFDRDRLTSDLHAAGFVGVAFEPCHTITRDTGTYGVFFASARRQPDADAPGSTA
ncbi:MAG: class I SAM-dependent methyltransferase [Nitriliruptor sp.]|nr:MAG: class I SAM-dependent methyltransferase [Nitriliruptor sp.]